MATRACRCAISHMPGTDTRCFHCGRLRVCLCFLKLDHMQASRIRSLSTTHIALIIFSLSFAIYAFSPQGSPTAYNLQQAGEVARVSISVAERGTFTDPFYSLPTGFTAHVAPAYAFVYAAVAKLFGERSAGSRTLRLFHIDVRYVASALPSLMSVD